MAMRLGADKERPRMAFCNASLSRVAARTELLVSLLVGDWRIKLAISIGPLPVVLG